MAYAQRPLTFAGAVVAAAGTSVAPSSPVPDNCVGICILNTSSTVPALVGFAVPGVALVERSTATRIPPGQSFTIPLGALGERGIMDESQLTGSGLVYDGVGAAVTLDITYQNYISTPGS